MINQCGLFNEPQVCQRFRDYLEELDRYQLSRDYPDERIQWHSIITPPMEADKNKLEVILPFVNTERLSDCTYIVFGATMWRVVNEYGEGREMSNILSNGELIKLRDILNKGFPPEVKG